MEQARVSRGDSWRALRDELSRDVVQDPGPVPRARLALALSVGERSQGDLQRALAMLDELLDPAHTPADALEPSLRALLNVQRDALERRLENLSRISRIELDSVLREAALAREAASHDQARAERDRARAALDQARERLRQVTRIELQHEATGG